MTPLRRAMFAEAAIALGVCLGAHLGIVEPIREKSRGVAAQLETARRQPSDPQGTASGADAALFARAERLRERAQAASDENTLFSAISRLAGRHGVALERVGAAPRAGEPNTGAGLATGTRVRSYALSVRGGYAGVTGFVDALESDVGLLLVCACEVVAGEDASMIDARLRIEVFDAAGIASAPAARGSGS